MKLHYLIIGIIFDAIDYIGLGMFPIVGDILDLFTAAFWYGKLGPLGLSVLVELIPLADALPMNIIMGFLADRKGEKDSEGKSSV